MAKKKFNKLTMSGVGRNVKMWLNDAEVTHVAQYSLDSDEDLEPYAFLTIKLLVDDLVVLEDDDG